MRKWKKEEVKFNVIQAIQALCDIEGNDIYFKPTQFEFSMVVFNQFNENNLFLNLIFYLKAFFNLQN